MQQFIVYAIIFVAVLYAGRNLFKIVKADKSCHSPDDQKSSGSICAKGSCCGCPAGKKT